MISSLGPDVSNKEPLRHLGDAERISVANVDKFYGDTPILRELSLEVARGEVVVVIGASGSGKTTLLRCIAGLEPIQSGRIDIFGVPVHRAWELKGDVGFVFQHFNLFPHMTALANVSLALRKVLKISRGEAKARALEALSLVGMDSFAGVRPRRLSGGQQQRVAIARSLAMSPRLMLFDEPTSALDRELVREVLTAMQELARQHMTMIVVSHELAFAEQVAHRLVYMDEGRVVEQGSPQAVLHHPTQERTRQFLGQITIDLEAADGEATGFS